MEHLICVNTNSFPADSIERAKSLFSDSLQGVLELNEGNDKFTFYLDSADNQTLGELVLAEGYTFNSFCNDTIDVDLHLFLIEVEDKSPALESVSEEVLSEMMNYSFYIEGNAVDENCDVYGLAWSLSAILLSLNTAEKWSDNEISICRTNNGLYLSENLSLYNISCSLHGRLIYEKHTAVDIQQVCQNNHLTNEFTNWFNALTVENKRRVIDKLELACAREFQGGEPLFKTLQNAEGLREIRVNAYPGGAIRMIFKPMTNGNYAILLGFIKKSNDEGYEQAISLANEIYSSIH